MNSLVSAKNDSIDKNGYTEALKEMFSDLEFMRQLDLQMKEMRELELVGSQSSTLANLSTVAPPLIGLTYGIRDILLIMKVFRTQLSFLNEYKDKLPELEKALEAEKKKNPNTWESSDANTKYKEAKKYAQRAEALEKMKGAITALEVGFDAVGALVAFNILINLSCKSTQ